MSQFKSTKKKKTAKYYLEWLINKGYNAFIRKSVKRFYVIIK